MPTRIIGGSAGENQPLMLGRVTHGGACTKLSW